MNDEADAETVSDLKELFTESFPDASCLRCGNSDFYILPASRQTFMMGEPTLAPKLLGVVTLACTRCGYVEQHLSAQLREASRPILTTKPAGPV